MAEAISALHGVCLSLLNSGFCLPASLLGAVPALSCCAFCLLLLLAAHPQSVSPGCFVERRKLEHAGEIFWSSHSLAQRRGKCSTCSAINTLALWKAWWVSWKIGRFSALKTFCCALLYSGGNFESLALVSDHCTETQAAAECAHFWDNTSI